MKGFSLRFSLFALANMALVGSCSGAPAASGTLRAPFDVPAPDAANARPPRPEGCPAAGPVATGIDVPSRYAPGGGAAKVDPQREAAYEAAIKPTNDFLRQVTLQANRYVRSKGRDIPAGLCAQSLLASWARGGAWREVRTTTGWFKLSTSLSGASLAWLQVAPVEGSAEDRRAITTFLGERADALRKHQDGLPSGNTTARNNHRYWAGLALAAAGTATNDRQRFDWGMGVLEEAACDVTPQGWLPLELQRRQRAHWYHAYALQPIVLLSEFAERNGRQGYDLCNGGVRRLAEATLEAADDPQRITAAAGGVQQTRIVFPDKTRLRGSLWGWLAPYGSRFTLPEPWPARVAASGRLAAVETGGDLAMLYPPAAASP